MKSMFEIAPVVMVAYNRPDHFLATLSALANNKLSEKTEVFVYIDGPKNHESNGIQKSIAEISYEKKHLFANLTVVKRSDNIGLRRNITQSITEVIEKYGSAIVLEDDIVTSPSFLTYMNSGLSFYKKEMKVWQISGLNPFGVSGKDGESFLFRTPCSWGWATWADRWSHYIEEPDEIIRSFSKKHIYEFDVEGLFTFWQQIIDNSEGRINTWAIFWYATIFKNRGLNVLPYRSLCTNIGFDSTGVHCGDSAGFDMPLVLDNSSTFSFSTSNDQFFDHLVHLRRLGRKPLDVPPDSAKGYRRVRNRIKKVRNRVRRYGIAQIIREIAISSEIRRSGYEDE